MLYKIIALQGDLNEKQASISYVHLEENGGIWSANCIHHKASPIAFSSSIPQLLQMPIPQFMQVESEVSNKLAVEINNFITEYELLHKVDFVATLGIHINDGICFENNASLALQLTLPVVGQFTAMNKAAGGNQAIFGIANDLLQIDVTSSVENKSIAIALLGALRWREAYNILATHTGATKNHIGGSIWLGVDA